MEEKIAEIISMTSESMVAVPNKDVKSASVEISSLFTAFIEWMLSATNCDWDWVKEDNYRIVHFLMDDSKGGEETEIREVTFNELFQYWLDNIYSK